MIIANLKVGTERLVHHYDLVERSTEELEQATREGKRIFPWYVRINGGPRTLELETEGIKNRANAVLWFCGFCALFQNAPLIQTCELHRLA